jgi:hypothetical protein
MFKFTIQNSLRYLNQQKNSFKKMNLINVRFGSSHGHGHHHEPHVPEGYAMVGKFCLITCYLWVMYRLKEDKGQLFGLYQPWLHEHHHEHIHYNWAGDEEEEEASDDV